VASLEDHAHLVERIAIDRVRTDVVELLKVDALISEQYTARVGLERCDSIAWCGRLGGC